jgi:hypothetical protein
LYKKPHVFATQVRVRQTLSVPGQSDGCVQPVHWPSLLQVWVPPHAVPIGCAWCETTPAVQASLVQGF